ncbi:MULTISPECIES: FeoA family protein [Coprobacillaceae]|uniref:FeoA family protein n=1 Tax=Coprobacillaceae TaxID=2810280 RepID=UPI000E533B60|nr:MULTISPECIES: FeoA family protein [Coprobacillaceae]RHM61520.1 ferrous iron transport protein A [Coprobacillus sp. AF33-1AC]RHS93935.1 ferrous iron transport protein A [Erysipelatoclostridium sp. AM42-17]
MPLTMLNNGEVGTITRIGGNEETRRFLNNLGFIVGEQVTVLSTIGGNVIVNVKDSRIAINEDMAKHIMI